MSESEPVRRHSLPPAGDTPADEQAGKVAPLSLMSAQVLQPLQEAAKVSQKLREEKLQELREQDA